MYLVSILTWKVEVCLALVPFLAYFNALQTGTWKDLAEWRGYENDYFSCNRDHIEISFVVHSISIPGFSEN